MISIFVHELLITGYERLEYFSQTWILTIAKKANVNQQKSKIMKNSIQRRKIQKMWHKKMNSKLF